MSENNIQFLLNNELTVIENCDPNMTVLNYLRQELSRKGTKEGCASGDCGACTAVLVEVATKENNQSTTENLSYQSINTCITFLSALHGKQLLTVEDLQQGNKLHVVQQAMVDCHGSQCGFCTPGFVMSLFSLKKNLAQTSFTDATTESSSSDLNLSLDNDIEHGLAGNLCRCTGYRSITDAAKQACNNDEVDQFDQDKLATINTLKNISKQQETVVLHNNDKSLYLPSTLDKLAQLVEKFPQAKLLAGGTDLALSVTQNMAQIQTMIAMGNVSELAQIKETEDMLSIGAMVSYQDSHALLTKHYPEFGQMLYRLGSTQVRNSGTLGGNVGNASPIGDTPPVLIALGAKLVLRKGQRTRVVSVEDYFVDYKVTKLESGEFIQRIEIPKAVNKKHLKVFKISKRLDDDISTVLACFYIEFSHQKVSDIKIAFGGMAGIPKRAFTCEQALMGKVPNDQNIALAMEALATDFSPLSDVRASSEYRLQVAKNLVRKCFYELEQTHASTRIETFETNTFEADKLKVNGVTHA
ncbi:MAG: xanthine dehydrogenase small subunit [Colwellia sp.]